MRGIVISCDSAELEQALLKLLDRPDLRQQMGEDERRLARDCFRWRAAGDRLLEVYRDIVQRPFSGSRAAGPGSG
jgi:glycosyltransferase involved in cell wall biosynthesis